METKIDKVLELCDMYLDRLHKQKAPRHCNYMCVSLIADIYNELIMEDINE